MTATIVTPRNVGSEEDGSEADPSETGTNNDSQAARGNKIFSIGQDLEDLNYHLASVFPNFTSKQAYSAKMIPKADTISG